MPWCLASIIRRAVRDNINDTERCSVPPVRTRGLFRWNPRLLFTYNVKGWYHRHHRNSQRIKQDGYDGLGLVPWILSIILLICIMYIFHRERISYTYYDDYINWPWARFVPSARTQLFRVAVHRQFHHRTTRVVSNRKEIIIWTSGKQQQQASASGIHAYGHRRRKLYLIWDYIYNVWQRIIPSSDDTDNNGEYIIPQRVGTPRNTVWCIFHEKVC